MARHYDSLFGSKCPKACPATSRSLETKACAKSDWQGHQTPNEVSSKRRVRYIQPVSWTPPSNGRGQQSQATRQSSIAQISNQRPHPAAGLPSLRRLALRASCTPPHPRDRPPQGESTLEANVTKGSGGWPTPATRRFSETSYDMRLFRRFQTGFPLPNGVIYVARELKSGDWALGAADSV
jgi:hypothetical protein